MQSYYQRIVMGVGLTALLACGGCGKKSAAPVPLPIEQVPQTLETVFKDAPPEANKAASEVVAAVQNEAPGALSELQDLSARTDLNEKQRIAAARAMAAYLQKLKETAEKGNKKAEEELQHYRATK